MHTSRREVRAQNVHRDRRPVCRRCARVRHRYRRAAQTFRHDLRRAGRRANDSQICRGRAHARRSMDESPQAKTKLTTVHARPKWIHPAVVRARCQYPFL